MISGMVVMVAGVIVVRVTIWGFIVLLVVLLVNPTMIVDIVFYCLDVRIDLYYILVYISVWIAVDFVVGVVVVVDFCGWVNMRRVPVGYSNE